MGKKNDNIYKLIAIVLIIVGLIGSFSYAGYHLWLSAVGSVLLLAKRQTQPVIIGKLSIFVGIIIMLYFALMLFKSLIP